MNILFVYTGPIIPESGGVQRVTDVLSTYFKKQNYNVYCLAVKKKKQQVNDNSYQYFLPNENNLDDEKNISYYINLINEKNINIVINQAALGGTLVKFCNYAKNKTQVKVISVIHNSLLGNVKHYASSHSSQIKFKYLRKFIELELTSKILKKIYIYKYKSKYEYTCTHSDKVVLLSENFFTELNEFTSKCVDSKIMAISNPCTLENSTKLFTKENELLYVGRIDTSQKKVDYLLEIWSNIQNEHPDWSLSIVGDGEERYSLEEKAKELNLKRIKFYGKQNPIPFYERAKILCMTSSYEGFPLVLAEAQVFGTIPIAFESFASVGDIIKDNENGILIKPFDLKEYSIKLSELMFDIDEMERLSKNAISSSYNFSMENIGKKWIYLFNHLLNKQMKGDTIENNN